MRYPHGRLLIFAKAPVPGFAKTRLIPALGAAGAAALQERLIRRTVALAIDARLAPVQLWTDGDDPGGFFECLRQDVAGALHRQRGADLGARMAHALTSALQDAEFAVLIGTDCPAMDRGYLEAACRALDDGTPVILGPAEDGGYVLVGARHAVPDIFNAIEWGSAAVMAQTRARLREQRLSWQELPLQWDLDRPEDLSRLDMLETGRA